MNRIPNAGFEKARDANAASPDAWTPHESGKVTCSWSAHEPRSGARCLEMTTDSEEKHGHAYWESDPFTVTPCVAYRVSFWFRAVGYGVPIFELQKVKNWRVAKKGTTDGWVRFEDVVVVPPDVSETRFIAHNYHRRGKTIWVDDIEMRELPLAESPLTRRLRKAQSAMAALSNNLAKLMLSDEQTAEVDSLQASLKSTEAAYAKLAAGAASVEDFQSADAGLGTIEKTLGSYLFTLWPLSPDDWEQSKRTPDTLGRRCEIELPVSAEGAIRQFIGIQCLIDEGLPGQLTIGRERATRDWEVRLLTTPAYRNGAPAAGPADSFSWGELNSLGELFLPPDTPRFVQVEINPGKAKPGEYRLQLNLDCLDRPTELGTVVLSIQVTPGQ
jgi:hypothetical protein